MKSLLKFFSSGLFIIVSLFLILFSNTQRVYAVDSSGQWVSLRPMLTARSNHGMALLPDGKVLIDSGKNSTDILSSSEIYDPLTGVWTFTGSLNTGRIQWASPNAVTLQNGKVLVAAGEGANQTDLGSTEIFDPTTGSWSFAADVNYPRRRAILAPLLDGTVLLASGSYGPPTPYRYINAAEIYDPSSNKWSLTNPMLNGRDSDERFVVLNDGGAVMIAGGESAQKSAEDTAETYNVSTRQWTISFMPYAMRGGTLTELADGRVLMTGGFDGTQVVAKTAIFDGVNWSLAAPMSVARSGHQAIFLSDGKVLVFGGLNDGGYLDTSEIYDPATNTWTQGPSLPGKMAFATVVQLKNGDYLSSGGSDGSNTLSASYLFTKKLVIFGDPHEGWAPAILYNNKGQVTLNCDFESKLCNRTDLYHTGIDSWGPTPTPAPKGSSKITPTPPPIVAVAPGRVISFSVNKACGAKKCQVTPGCYDYGFGNAVILEHTIPGQPNVYSLYGHMASLSSSVKVGACLPKGTQLGIMGSSGYGLATCWGSEPHLHLEIKSAGVFGDPYNFLYNQYPQGLYFGYSPVTPNTLGYFDPKTYRNNVEALDCPN